MIIQIEHNSPVPIYEQLVKEIEGMIASGELSVNESLPSIRQLALQIDVAVNTVARAYMELERRGLIISNGRKGTFVKDTGSLVTSSRDFKELIIELIKKGLNKKEIEQTFNQSLNQIFN